MASFLSIAQTRFCRRDEMEGYNLLAIPLASSVLIMLVDLHQKDFASYFGLANA